MARRSGRASVQMAVYHDGFASTAVSGGETSSPGLAEPTATQTDNLASVSLSIPTGMLLDPTTGSFRALATGYSTSGMRFSASSALTPALWIAAEYSSGDALSSDASLTALQPIAFQDALSALKVRRSQTAVLALKGRIVGTGTRVRASYRWQPLSGVTAVDPYSAFGDQAYLSCQIRQNLHMGHIVPQGLQATIDVTNLLAQGYRPFLSADGQTLYFAQAPRTIQAGLAFSF